MWFVRLAIAIVLLTCTSAEKQLQQQSDRSEYKRSLNKDCENAYSVTCFKLDIISWVDRLNENENFSVIPGVSIVRENVSAKINTADIVAELARDFPNNAEARLDAFLMKKIQGFLTNHSVKLNLYDQEDVGSARRKGGGKKGGGGGMSMIFAAAAMMKSTLLALALGALAALAGKALMTGLISLLLSAIIGLKSLQGGGGKTTYEVVSKPVYSHSNSHSTGHEDYHHGQSGYGRSFDIPLPLGLQPEYKPA